MTLINASILAGVLLAAVPLVLHLIMRARPKRIEFPALRLLLARQTSNARRMRVRHILLLILRALVILLAVIALARPSLPPAQYSLTWYEWILLAAVIAGAVAAYRYFSQRMSASAASAHVVRQRRTRLRLFALLGGVLAALMCVGLPWGLRVRAELTGPVSNVAPDVPVAAVFVFDNSLSMTYRHESETRLEQAARVAAEHLSVLPDGSRVAVSTLAPDAEAVFQADLAGVRSRIEDLKPQSVVRTLNKAVRQAIEAQIDDRDEVARRMGGGDAFAREIYLLSDLSVANWDEEDEQGLHDLLVQHEWLQVYLIDVGIPNPVNISLGQLRLDREATVQGQPVDISVAVSATGAAPAEAALELFLLDADGNELRGGGGVRTVRFQGSPPVARFFVKPIPDVDSQRGYIRLSTPDPMPVDDIRYFAFGVAPVPRVLLVSDDELDTWLLKNALQPEGSDLTGDTRYDCRTVTGAGFLQQELTNYDIVCVVNWTRPPAEAWAALHEFAQRGGGVFIVTGGRQMLDAASWSTPEAQKLLPGIPLAAPRFRPQPAQLNMVAEDHPVVRSFVQNKEALTELSFAIFDRAWSLDLASDARVLMAYNDRSRRPALVERSAGRGRVLMFTSAMDNTPGWNEGLISLEPWGFLMLVDQCMQSLTGMSEVRRNFTVGEPVEIFIPESARFTQYRVTRPRFRSTEGTFEIGETSVLLTDIDEAGHYQLRSADENSSFELDFAANDQDAESNLTALTPEQLNSVFGADRYVRVTDPRQLDRAVSVGRLGMEVYPVLMGLLILLFCSEHLMANFFYDEEPVEAGTA